jgi:hypothetical protein
MFCELSLLLFFIASIRGNARPPSDLFRSPRVANLPNLTLATREKLSMERYVLPTSSQIRPSIDQGCLVGS